jgi:hypothetical protein
MKQMLYNKETVRDLDKAFSKAFYENQSFIIMFNRVLRWTM